MLKCITFVITNLPETVLLENLPAHFHNAISVLERNKEGSDHPHYMPVGSLYHPWEELPRQRLCATMCA